MTTDEKEIASEVSSKEPSFLSVLAQQKEKLDQATGVDETNPSNIN